MHKIINDHDEVVEVKVWSKEKIDETTNKEIAEILMKHYSAKEVNLIEILDEKLLGGFKIEVEDEVIDLSIRNKIGQLQKYLTKNA